MRAALLPPAPRLKVSLDCRVWGQIRLWAEFTRPLSDISARENPALILCRPRVQGSGSGSGFTRKSLALIFRQQLGPHLPQDLIPVFGLVFQQQVPSWRLRLRDSGFRVLVSGFARRQQDLACIEAIVRPLQRRRGRGTREHPISEISQIDSMKPAWLSSSALQQTPLRCCCLCPALNCTQAQVL